MNSSKRFLALAALACLVLAVGCSDDDPVTPPDPLSDADFVFVDAGGGSADGAGTKADPLQDLQAGIDLAAAGGKDVCVAEGVFDVASDTGSPILMAPTVSLYGGYANTDGEWTRESSTLTLLRDLAAAGGTFAEPNAAVACLYGAQDGEAPVIDGFTLRGGGGDLSAALHVSEGSSVKLTACDIEVGGADHAFGIKNYSGDRDSGTLVTVLGCSVTGGGGAEVCGIYVSRGALTVLGCAVGPLTATGRVFGIDCGYGDIAIVGSTISGGNAPGSTRALYLNEAFLCTVSGCTLYGGDGGSESYGIQAMDTEDAGSISGNTIDGGSGTTSIGLEMGWVEVNPSVDGNLFRAAGGTNRYGIQERDNVSDPVSLTQNTFDGSLLTGTGISVFYSDYTANTRTGITTIEAVNALDEDGLNPAGTVSGNSTTPY